MNVSRDVNCFTSCMDFLSLSSKPVAVISLKKRHEEEDVISFTVCRCSPLLESLKKDLVLDCFLFLYAKNYMHV